MEGFINWFLQFIEAIIGGILEMINGIAAVFDIPYHISALVTAGEEFVSVEWLLAVLTMVLVFGFIIVFIFIVIKHAIRSSKLRRAFAGTENAAEEIVRLRQEVSRLKAEKDDVLGMKLASGRASEETLAGIFSNAAGHSNMLTEEELAALPPEEQKAAEERFSRLKAVDEKYHYYIAPKYDVSMNLTQICNTFRNYACYELKLFYDIKAIRLLFAGLASSKLILLQGISGTGKTSLPYALGKFLKNDATIASVQPSWKDKTELFGYFNEFTRKFNETEVLRRVYEASFNDDIHVIILDEMNIARIEYYFAEMLSILEMPDPSEWKIDLVASSWDTDPDKLNDGQLTVPTNIWYVGTANNDDSTFAVSDKVYDRAMVINLETKGVPFSAPKTDAVQISYSHLNALFSKASKEYSVDSALIQKIAELDNYVVEKFRISFGNRIMKQIYSFIPVYVACGGSDVEALDYLLATKVIRKFEALNLALVRDEFPKMAERLDEIFGEGRMTECHSALKRLEKLY